MGESDLPEIYTRYFELRQLGWHVPEIIKHLDIPAESAETFIELAHAKLARPQTDDPLRVG